MSRTQITSIFHWQPQFSMIVHFLTLYGFALSAPTLNSFSSICCSFSPFSSVSHCAQSTARLTGWKSKRFVNKNTCSSMWAPRVSLSISDVMLTEWTILGDNELRRINNVIEDARCSLLFSLLLTQSFCTSKSSSINSNNFEWKHVIAVANGTARIDLEVTSHKQRSLWTCELSMSG